MSRGKKMTVPKFAALLFIGSVPAGYCAADLMALVSSAIRNDLDVFA